MPVKMEDGKRKPHFALSIRWKPHMGDLLETVARRMTLDKTTVLMLALQEFAEKRGIPVPEEEETAAA